MAEFVEQGARVVGRQQRRLALGALGEVHDVDDQRRDFAVQRLLVAQRGHPGAGTLRGTREVIAVEQRLVLAAGVLHLPDPHVGMPDRNVLALMEGDAEQARRAVERGSDHVVEGEIGLDRGVVEVGALAAQLLGVVAPVPRREGEVAALLRDQRLQRVAIGQRPRPCRAPDPLQQVADRLRRPGHGVLEAIGGEGRIAEQPRAFLPQRQDFDDGGVVVVGVAVVAARREGLEDLLAQIAAAGILQEGLDRGARQRDDRLARHVPFRSRSFRGGDKALRQSIPVGFAEFEKPGLLVRQQMVAEGGAELRQPLVDIRHALFRRIVEASAGAMETGVGALQQPHLLRRKTKRRAVLVQMRDAPEQHRVHQDRVPVPGLAQRHLAVDLQQFWARMRRNQIVEHSRHLAEQLPRALQRHDGVGKIG